MSSAWLARMRRRLEAPFPERHIYMRAGGEVRGVVLTTGRQLAAATAAGGLVLWLAVSTLGMAVAAGSAYVSQQRVRSVEAASVRQMARHDARLIAAVDTLARTRADHFRTTLDLAGVSPDSIGPIVATAEDVARMRALASASSRLPLARPTADIGPSSGYGTRRDPITGRAAFHPGLDFPRPKMTPVYATAPGVVSFAGARSGYGDMVEITHDRGFVTRFAHLAAITVGVGQRVVSHQRIGAIGSTGRSTGPHLHYEVRRDGHPLDPQRFLKAGDYVQQAG